MQRPRAVSRLGGFWLNATDIRGSCVLESGHMSLDPHDLNTSCRLQDRLPGSRTLFSDHVHPAFLKTLSILESPSAAYRKTRSSYLNVVPAASLIYYDPA
ncbi:hypothetical protein POSPLADRAFT_1038445 [Postia placenta MAD-698-R-SB12]|uniref:Uncharacterized protein n=1 Tax=Postia placenta MAD-698-R-SB12 TaxID=670580 RepID=A0A1X6NBI4_9APHY|nr:hypothetical protein POSPLADRAFT_1038445 [Postia placenta MAD-698-R-SB12]OSX65934.1 hypothetical protein POSPLADRAFT_1038445 [Postia placenta MAD-698-R-SB12]